MLARHKFARGLNESVSSVGIIEQLVRDPHQSIDITDLEQDTGFFVFDKVAVSWDIRCDDRHPGLHGLEAVSYTHLTLPTNR